MHGNSKINNLLGIYNEEHVVLDVRFFLVFYAKADV